MSLSRVQYGTASYPVTVSDEAGEAEFVGYYRSGKVGANKQNLSEFRAGEIPITVDNVADGFRYCDNLTYHCQGRQCN